MQEGKVVGNSKKIKLRLKLTDNTNKVYTPEELTIDQDATACGSFLKGGSVIGMSKMDALNALNAIEIELNDIKENIRYLKHVLE